MNPITKAQDRVLKYIKRHLKENGYPPTRGEIAQHFGWASKTAAQQHLEALQAKGFISLASNLSRGIKLT